MILKILQFLLICGQLGIDLKNTSIFHKHDIKYVRYTNINNRIFLFENSPAIIVSNKMHNISRYWLRSIPVSTTLGCLKATKFV